MLNLDQALAAATDVSGRANTASVELWTVKSVNGSLCTVVSANQTLDLPYARSYRIEACHPMPGDIVLVLRAGSGAWIVCAFGEQPKVDPPQPPPIPTPEPPKPVVNGSNTFLPGWTGTFRGGWRGDTSDLYQGDWTGRGINTGAAFYQGQVTGLRGATANGASVHIKRGAGGADAATAPTLVLLGVEGTTAPPNVLASTGAPALTIGAAGDAGIPVDWAQRLIDGTADGIGIYVNGSQPYVQVLGRNNDAASLALHIDWSRPS